MSDQLFKDNFGERGKRETGDNPFNKGIMSPAEQLPGIMTTGIVTCVYPQSMTADIETDNDTFQGCRLGSMHIGPNGGGASVLPEVGTEMLICLAVTPPVAICAIVKAHATEEPEDRRNRDITLGSSGFGGQDTGYAGGGAPHLGGRSDQILPGEFLYETPEGNSLALLRGITLLKGSDISQILLSNAGGLVRVISNLYQHFNAAGVTEIFNKDGKTTIRVALGSQTNDDGEVLSQLEALFGDEGDLVDIKITTLDQDQVARFFVSPEGNVEFDAASIEMAVEKEVSLKANDIGIGVDGSTTLKGKGAVEISSEKNMDLFGASVGLRSGGGMKSLALGDIGVVSGGRIMSRAAKALTQVSGEAMQLYGLNSDFKCGSFTPQGAILQAGLIATPSGDVDVTGAQAVLGGVAKTKIRGISVELGEGVQSPVVRVSDLQQLVDAIFAYINAASVVVVAPTPKLTIPSLPGLNPLSAAIAALGSKIVTSS